MLKKNAAIKGAVGKISWVLKTFCVWLLVEIKEKLKLRRLNTT